MSYKIQSRIKNVDWRSVALETFKGALLILAGMMLMLMLLDNYPGVIGYAIEPYLEEGYVPL